MISHGLHFGTINALPNHQIPTVAASLNIVIQIFHCWGFCITMTLANLEFEPLQERFGWISFNFCAQDKHVPEIECYIHTEKERTQSGYNSFPFECILWLMLICLVANVVFWLNAFHTLTVLLTLSCHVIC